MSTDLRTGSCPPPATAARSSAAGTASRWRAALAAPRRGRRGTGVPRAAIDYLGQVARAAEQLGFEGVLTPTGTWCEDAWLVTAALLSRPERLKFLVAFRPGLISPVAGRPDGRRPTSGSPAAGCCSTWSPAGEAERAAAVRRPPATRTSATRARGEFLAVVRGAWARRAVRLRRRALHVEGATVRRGPGPAAGRSTSAVVAGRRAGGRQARRRLPDLGRAARRRCAEKVAWMRGLAGEQGRTLRFGMRMHTITRDTARGGLGRGRPAARRPRPGRRSPRPSRCSARASPIGQQPDARAARRVRVQRGARPGDLPRTCGPGSGWSAAARAPPWSAATQEVADRIEEYAALGIDEFILSGYPHLEEAYWFGEGVLPELRRRGALAPAPPARRSASCAGAR